MDYSRGASNAIAIIPDAAGPEAWVAAAAAAGREPANPDPMWATEEDYHSWAADPSPDPSATPGGKQPPNKRALSKAIGRMFFKTKLCCKFRAGTCPYPNNCNFAHGVEELRKPPPNWEEIVAAHREGSEPPPPPREEHQIPIISSSSGGGDGQRSYKGRHCKRFYTDEGCPYGDTCTFLHDEQSRVRESVAISLSPSVGGGGVHGNVGSGGIQKPSNWKTRICNKWEMTGYCPFGSKCHFAHGATELHKYGGGTVDSEGRDAILAAPDLKQAGALSKAQIDTAVGSSMLVPHVDIYHVGVPSQRSTGVNARQGQRPLEKWKGPDKISKIYGDWIDDLE